MSVIPTCLFKKGLSLVVKGQEQVYDPISTALKVSEMGFGNKGTPKHSFLFLGPTGVGKTETAKCINEMVFGNQELVAFDMGSYQTPETLQHFVQTFIDKLQEIPPSVILFDEIEKGTPEITTLLLAILDEGRYSYNGETFSMEQHYLIFTSNLGCKAIIDLKEADFSTIERQAKAEAEDYFRPEILARFKSVIVYNLLPYPVQKEICITFLERYLQEHQDKVVAAYDNSIIPILLERGVDERLGVRPLKICIEQQIGRVLAESGMTHGLLTVRNREIIFINTNTQ